MIKGCVREAGFAALAAVVFACAPIEHALGQDTGAAGGTDLQAPASLQPVTVAFIGDQGLTIGRVLRRSVVTGAAPEEAEA